MKTDFGKVSCDSYHVGGYTDHITAWRACYDTAHLVGGSDKEMTLIRSGHIQSVVYPADSTRYDRWYGPPTATDPDEWLKTADRGERLAVAALDRMADRPLRQRAPASARPSATASTGRSTPAPGTYVFE